MDLLAKKISELTEQELNDLFKAFGTLRLPYPASRSVLDSDGTRIRLDKGKIADDDNPLGLYSDQTREYVIGQLYRNMAIPSMQLAQKTAIENRAPDSKNRLMLILGNPGSGKSELAKTLARARDPRGPVVIDCGGRYMSDLLYEQVIDYGEGYKTALTDKIRSGLLSSQRSIEIFKEQFPDALKEDKDGNVIDIDWEKAKEPKINGTKENPEFGTKAEGLEKALQYLRAIAESEGIPPESTNAVGIKKQKGAIIRAFEEGRELILDEYTKSIEGSDDSLQTVIQFLNGEIDETTVDNGMKDSLHPENDSFTFRRKDMRVGFFVTATGNEDGDGVSTHALSNSANSRITTFTIKDPLLEDWEHRISQVMTGLPLTTLRGVFPGMEKDKFANTMIQLRQIGLSEEEQANIPPEQLTNLKHWEETKEAIEVIAQRYMFLSQIVDPDSKLNNEIDVNTALSDSDEVTASFRDKCAIDFRKFIQANAEALKIKSVVKPVEDSSGASLDLSAVNQKIRPPVRDPEVVSAEYGTRMEQVMLDQVATLSAGKENLNEALVKNLQELGILTKEGPGHGILAKLLNQKLEENLGSTSNMSSFRDVLFEHLKETNPGKSKDEVVPRDRTLAAFKELKRLSAESTGTNPREGRIVLLGDKLSDIFNKVSAVDGIRNENPPAPTDLIRTSDFLESLKIPALADINMQGIWRTTVSADKIIAPSDITTPVVEMAEGKHSSGLGITTVMMQGANNNEPVPVHIMRNDSEVLIVTDKADAETKAALGDNYTVVAYGDADAKSRVSGFIRKALGQSSRKSSVTALEQQLTAAFMLRAGNEGKLRPLPELMTTRNLPAEAPVYMINKPL